MKVKVAQLCPTLCYPMDYTVHGILRPEYWSGEPLPSPGDLPIPGMEPRSPKVQADSLLAEPPGKEEVVGKQKRMGRGKVQTAKGSVWL